MKLFATKNTDLLLLYQTCNKKPVAKTLSVTNVRLGFLFTPAATIGVLSIF